MNAENTPGTHESQGLNPSSEASAQDAFQKSAYHPDTTEQDVQQAIKETRSSSVYWLILLAGLVLMASLPEQARWIDTKRGWFTQPMVGSALGLGTMVLFAAWKVLFSCRIRSLNPGYLLEAAFISMGRYRVAIITSGLFFLYINTLSVIGFVPATLAFVTLLLWLARLLDRFWFSVSVFTLFVIVLIFRVGLSLWLPDVWLYEFLPEHWAVFANQYL